MTNTLWSCWAFICHICLCDKAFPAGSWDHLTRLPRLWPMEKTVYYSKGGCAARKQNENAKMFESELYRPAVAQNCDRNTGKFFAMHLWWDTAKRGKMSHACQDKEDEVLCVQWELQPYNDRLRTCFMSSLGQFEALMPGCNYRRLCELVQVVVVVVVVEDGCDFCSTQPSRSVNPFVCGTKVHKNQPWCEK